VKQAVLLTAIDKAVSRDSIVDGDWLRATDWCKRYLYDTIIIRSYGRREKLWVGFLHGAYYSPVERLSSVDSNGNIETRHPVEGQFGSEFRAIWPELTLYGMRSYGGLKSQHLKIMWAIFAFFNEPLR